jgi:hypothetical protein
MGRNPKKVEPELTERGTFLNAATLAFDSHVGPRLTYNELKTAGSLIIPLLISFTSTRFLSSLLAQSSVV